jgi:hypothetical protein
MRTASIVSIIALATGVAHSASGQTIIDMPPPPAPAPAVIFTGEAAESATAVAPPASARPTAASQTNSPTVGDIALTRYARARSGKYNTYSNDMSYWNNGVRVYTYPRYYPQFVWGPFWGGSWPWRCW